MVEDEEKLSLQFEGASFIGNGIPNFSGIFDCPTEEKVEVNLIGATYAPITADELKALPQEWIAGYNAESPVISQAWTEYDGVKAVFYRITPFRINPRTKELEKLVSFDIEPQIIYTTNSVASKTGNWAAHSQLQSGKWLKASIAASGMYKVKVSDLHNAGLAIQGEASNGLMLYHNAGGTLSEGIAQHRYDDLQQIAIQVNDGGDGVLNSSDEIIFYAQGPHAIKYNAQLDILTHQYNVYDERSYIYFTYKPMSNGLRVQSEPWNGGNATLVSNGFDELKFHELDERNLAGTGREWYGEVFDFTLSRSFAFSFPNRITTDEVKISAKSASSGPANSVFNFSEGSNVRLSVPTGASSGVIEFVTSSNRSSFMSSSQNININANYSRSSQSVTGYLDWIRVQARRSWTYQTGGFVARDTKVISPGDVVSYQLVHPNALVWDVTEPTRPFAPQRDASGIWLAPADSLRTYLVSSTSDATYITSFSSVDNQDLHGLTDVEMVIITPNVFKSQAEELAEFRRNNNGLSVEVITLDQVYNEFSCGQQDITAIRDFARMLYKRNSSNPLKYLLLFGDASYDYKDRVANKQNFVPIYQSVSSNSLYYSFMTDDYYSHLDDMEGVNVVDEKNDIGVGRLPVKSVTEAQNVVDKLIGYSIAEQSFGDWRNRLTFVSDDADEAWETQLTRAPEVVAQRIDTLYPQFNITKVYADSYVQQSTSGSQSYPAARDELYRSVERGNLITGYTGHGGEVGWASERLLQLQDVNNWTNGYQLPLFVTITCEFTRFDDPARTSAGEQLFLNPNGGAVGLISTTRVVYVPGAVSINSQVFSLIFEKDNGEYPTLGEVVRKSKNAVNASDVVRFSLIGDPSMRLNYPVNDVVLDSVNGYDPANVLDTLRARDLVTLKGRVLHANGGLFDDFQGEVSVTIFDKPVDRQTKRNDGVGSAVDFTQQSSIIFKGRASADTGYWQVSFIVPRDINYTFGEGKISLYANNTYTDAGGADRRFNIGGLSNAVVQDDEGPEIRLFMNDTNFINGGITDDSPIGLALLFDESGINVVGNGIGHNIVGVLDGDENSPINLNSDYEGDIDTYKSGTVRYPFFNLADGEHSLKVRVWDVMNNVSEATVDFVVADRENLVIQDLFNYPNPFTESTRFSFEHNRAGEALEVELHIINQQGQLVYSETQSLSPEGNRTLDMTWDATGNGGQKVAAGVYVFRLVVRSLADGSEASESERLVFLK